MSHDQRFTEADLRLRVEPRNEGALAALFRPPVLEATALTVTVRGREVEASVPIAGLAVVSPEITAAYRAKIEALVRDRLLDGAHHPVARFAGTVTTADGGALVVEGGLTLRGVTRPCALRIDHGEARFTVRQRDFGIEPVRAFGGALASADELALALAVAPGGAS